GTPRPGADGARALGPSRLSLLLLPAREGGRRRTSGGEREHGAGLAVGRVLAAQLDGEGALHPRTPRGGLPNRGTPEADRRGSRATGRGRELRPVAGLGGVREGLRRRPARGIPGP